MLLPPALIMIVGAALLPLLPSRGLRSSAAVLLPALTLWAVVSLPEGAVLRIPFLTYELIPLSVDPLSRIFAIIFTLVAAAGGLYAFHLEEAGQQSTALVYGGAAVGVVFAGDLFTLLFFTEVMAVFSTWLVWARRTPEAERAGQRYLLMHLLGGSFMMGGILLHLASTGTLAVGAMDPAQAASWIILVGVALNAAIPPLHPWLPDAYPKATVTGAVFMSAFTTKSSVYVLVRMYAGYDILLWLGVAMTLYGVVYAVLANDIRSILAYHIISQVGYMVAGVGIGTALALNGTVSHAYSHILYKGLLFMGAGAVLHTTGRSKLTELGGLYRRQPLIFWLYMVGAFSISGMPLFNGFISKSMVVTAAGYEHYTTAKLLLLLASIGTFLSLALKLPWGTWFAGDRDLRPRKAPVNMLIGMGTVAFLCVLYGVAPGLLYRLLPFEAHYEPYTLAHLVEAIQILGFSFLAFWLLKAMVAGKPKLALDTDWFYRRPAPLLRRLVVDSVDGFFRWSQEAAVRLVHRATGHLRHPAPALQRLVTPPGAVRAEGYDPDRARPLFTSVIALVLLVFVVLAVFALAA